MRALDLFCGAGGVSKGLADAGFDVWGVDIRLQPRYVHPGRFIQGDALNPPVRLADFDFIWASPPCQAYTVSRTRAKQRKVYPELIDPVRDLLASSGRPWVMENVPGAPLVPAFTLCGASFGLGATGDDGVFRQLRRHRHFETHIPMLAPSCACNRREKIGVYGNGGGWANRFDPDRRGYKGNVREAREAMGMDWCGVDGLSQAIPPAYAEFIGRAALAYIAQSERAAA